VTAVGLGDQMDPLVPMQWHPTEIQAGLANRFQYLWHLAAAR
jgi:hypothetical protein